jgi:ribosomal protein S18 acetylase RimI-like enzyme
MTPTARHATPADAPTLTRLLDAYRVFYKKPSDLAAAAAFLAERFVKGDSVIFIAETNGSTAGFAQLYPTWTTVGLKARWTLNDLYVDPAFRRMGIGAALVEACESHARETGAQDIQLLTEHTNADARRLYDGRNWKLDSVYARYTLRFGA